MKKPVKFNTYCPYCRKHTEHEVERVKKGKTTGLHWIDRQKARRSNVGNRGKFGKVPGGDKPTKKINMRYRCKECGKAHLREGYRAGKFELTE
ncbi:50S ribosomal protein L44e [Methanocorpusculum labreanum]|jgi:large subunit ribosomal protein L44e|uniref:Large ribosomal subunit protein eL42 n=1 Tax=Methanocorpusculum labreanum (strain ATCC 43576 / DSM 4855 / Z) TaxID=410358 RepID=A2ST13_METLZ|nr:50S ribosomal protein L44e [Methanocorpusculum labreanum]ABN07469.1 LSU ribosomal protein L44E [Methanocorpusculum labreanum Z]